MNKKILMFVLVIVICAFLTYKNFIVPCKQPPEDVFNGTMLGCVMTMQIPNVMIDLHDESCHKLEREPGCELNQEDFNAVEAVIKEYMVKCMKTSLDKDNFCTDEGKIDGILKK